MVRAGVIATPVAIAFNYLGFRYWTYRHADKQARTRELALFLLFSGIGLVIENGVLALSHYGLGWDSPLADNSPSSRRPRAWRPLFRFWSYRTWVFRALPVPVRRPVHRTGHAAGPVRPAAARGRPSEGWVPRRGECPGCRRSTAPASS